MTSTLTFRGGDDFAGLARALRKVGRSDLNRVLTKGMMEGANALIPLVREAAGERLPQRGGLAEKKASEPMVVQVPATATTPRVTIVVKNTQPGYESGKIRHPVFERDKSARKGAKDRGDAEVPWVVQHVDGEWFDGTIRDNARRVVIPAMEAAFDVVAENIVREARA